MSEPTSTEPEQLLASVPAWPLWLAGLVDVAAAVTYVTGAASGWWFGAIPFGVTGGILLWHTRRASRLGFEQVDPGWLGGGF